VQRRHLLRLVMELPVPLPSDFRIPGQTSRSSSMWFGEIAERKLPWLAGAFNLSLMVLNIRDGLHLTGRHAGISTGGRNHIPSMGSTP
jgi:hypothetical protein